MTKFERPLHSRELIKLAGESLKESIPETEVDEDLYQMFRIAHNWRQSHMRPMHLVRADLSGKCRKFSIQAISAARIKRFQSIRRKLRTTSLRLDQIQDIGGCRLIFNTIDDMNNFEDLYFSDLSKFEMIKKNDYISFPKLDGYRSKHFVVKFIGKDEDSQHNNQRIEIQIRTKLQHAWATAVEAVGLVRQENLKSGEGDPNWLRLFQIMSSELAHRENQPVGRNLPENENERRKELLFLNKELNALNELESYRSIIKQTEVAKSMKLNFFTLEFDPCTNTVSSGPYFFKEKNFSTKSDLDRAFDSNNSVIIEIDKFSDLRKAFPNYYLDVEMFTKELRKIIHQTTEPTFDFKIIMRDYLKRKRK
ncbi:MAG: RelA/SpoT domain-containing protein [Rhodospirillales bacterium]